MSEKLKLPYTAFLADRTSPLYLLEPLLEYITGLARQRQPGIVIISVPYHVHEAWDEA